MVRVQAEVTATYETARAISAELLALRQEVLPAAQQTFDSVQEGYRLGKFDILAVLDAQRTLIQTRSRYLDAQITYSLAIASLERLTGYEFKKVSREDGGN
jgi:cobalt-zinc-cadmium efflux system outer membrane protein